MHFLCMVLNCFVNPGVSRAGIFIRRPVHAERLLPDGAGALPGRSPARQPLDGGGGNGGAWVREFARNLRLKERETRGVKCVSGFFLRHMSRVS